MKVKKVGLKERKIEKGKKGKEKKLVYKMVKDV